jgi:hypothetical protein
MQTMMRLLLTVTTFVFLAVNVAAQAPSPDSGSVQNGVYRSDFFAFTYSYPATWVTHGDETNKRIMEAGAERAKETKALSEAATKTLEQHTFQLLTVFQYALGTPGLKSNPAIQIIAEDVRHAPAITDGRIYLLNVRPLLTKMGYEIPQTEPNQVMIDGHQFFRLDSDVKMDDLTTHQTFVISFTKGYIFGFIFSGTRDQVEESIKTLNSVKFISSPR